MGFMEDVQDSLQREVDSAGRSVETARLNMKISDVQKRRKELAAQLGASLYEVAKSDPNLVAGREALFDGIAALDAERAGYEAQIQEIERKEHEALIAASTVECPFCHYRLRSSDMFCSGCGKPMAEIKAASEKAPEPEAPAADCFCMNCGTKLAPGDKFCMNCGTKVTPSAESATADAEMSAEPAAAPAE